MFEWFRRKPEPEIDLVTDSVPLTTLIRWYIYDLRVKEANRLATEFEMVPVSEEGDEKERHDSNLRRERIEPLFPLMEIFAEINAKAVTVLQQEDLAAIGIAEEQYGALQIFYENLSLAALTATISAAAQLGLITVTGTITNIGELDD